MLPGYVLEYAPLVWLHSEDPFRPSDLLTHIEHTTAKWHHEPVRDLPELSLENLAVADNDDPYNDPVALTSNDNVTSLPEWLYGGTPDASGNISNVTACVIVLVPHSPLIMDAFYWYFYSYDRGPNISQVLEPMNGIFGSDPPSYTFGDHVGDWEHSMIRFRDGLPTGIYYSQHRDGAAYDWDDLAVSKSNDTRPIVYSAYGSHANYPTPGNNTHDMVLIDYCDAGVLWDPVLSAYVYMLHTDNWSMEPLTRLGSDEPLPGGDDGFINYEGLWGDVQYPDSHPEQQTVPYFGLKRFVSGPTGPIRKSLQRATLSPRPRSKSWTEWVVGVLLYWYPCCIRGWRKWLSLVVLITFPFLIIIGFRHGVRDARRRWKKDYTRIDTEIPLEDMVSESSRSSTRLSTRDDREQRD